jgi:hypothetical protein
MRYATTNSFLTGAIPAGSSFGAAGNRTVVCTPQNFSLDDAGQFDTALYMWAASAYTQPGSAAGTASLKTLYYLLDAF